MCNPTGLKGLVAGGRMKIAWSALCLALVAAQGIAQETTGSLSGFVLDSNHRPVYGAVLKASDRMHSVVRTVTTDTSGFYRLAEMAAAEYEESGSAPGVPMVTAD